MNNKKTQRNSGFTLVEIMVSVAIFAIIMTTGIGALVSLTNSYKESQRAKQVNDSLNYALETITREARLGTSFAVKQNPDSSSTSILPSDGSEDAVGFNATDNRGYVIFWEENGVLYRSIHNPTNGTFLSRDALTNPDEVEITQTRFTVIGTDPLSGSPNNYQQPLVWIQIQARAPNSEKTSTVQTLVSQRVLDA